MSHPAQHDAHAWHPCTLGAQPTCPVCGYLMPYVFGEDRPVRIRVKPGTGRGPTPDIKGWIHFSYRHRKCNTVLEVAVRALRLLDVS